MKRTIVTTLLLLLTAVFFTACTDTKKQSSSKDVTEAANSDKLRVVATIFPQYDFMREIAGDNVELTMLLPPGSESHSFEPTPQDIIAIQNCDMFIYSGGDSDSWIDSILDSMDTSKMEIISLMDLVDIVEEEIVEGMEEDPHEHEEADHEDENHAEEADHEDEAAHAGDEAHEEEAAHEDETAHAGEENHAEDEEHEAEYDEHVWTSPLNAKIIVQALADKLCSLDSENSDIYKKNTTAYLEKLDTLNDSFLDAVASGKRKTLVFGDRFPFRYFADAYQLDYFAAFPGCSTETEASAATVSFLIDKVKAENIPVVFYIEFSNEKMAATICEAAGAKKLLLHSCHNVAKSDFESGVNYMDLMTQNVENIREALK